MEAKIASGVLFAVLLACGYTPAGSFRAKSVHAPDYPQIAKEAVELDAADVEVVSVAGGQRIGQYFGPEGAYVSFEVAHFGGTHFLARGSRTKETGGQFVPGGWVKTSRTTTLYDVFRVPVGAWESLPAALKPSAQ